MFGILAKFFRFSGRENGNKFKLSIVIGLVEALASAMKIPAIMYILIGLLSGKPIGKYIGGSIAIMVIAIVVDVICKRYSTVLQTEGGYNANTWRCSCESGYADHAGNSGNIHDHSYAVSF